METQARAQALNRGAPAMPLLVLNAGSSSLKCSVFDDNAETALARASVQWQGKDKAAVLSVFRGEAKLFESQEKIPGLAPAVRQIQRILIEKIGLKPGDIRAIGQRVVHGGTAFRESVRLDARLRREIKKLNELAPLHNPPALQSIDGAARAFPGIPQIAVFDTAFYAGLPLRRVVYPLPYKWFEEWGVRRFGFHGISHASSAARAAELLDRRDLRVVSCHLGNGCSVTASRAGKALSTTMGFTPLEGLMMGTRSGSVDPGILLYVQRKFRFSGKNMESALIHESGLKGVSGVSNDIRSVEKAAREGNGRARLALDMFADRVREAIGAMAVTLGGLDALAFTGGIGENSASVREAACQGLECLSIHIDPEKNKTARFDDNIASSESKVQVLVVRAEEEKLIAQETARLLK